MTFREERIGNQRLILGDCLEVMPTLGAVDAVVTDPPYGVAWKRNARAKYEVAPIANDHDASFRDEVIKISGVPGLYFGSTKVQRPDIARMVLIWDTKGALGMGAIDLPWKPSHQEIYVVGKGFCGHRGTDVLSFAPVHVDQRKHPHQKPVDLICELIGKCPGDTILDPFMGSGTTLVACQKLGRHGIGIEIDPDYFDIACRRVDEATRQPDLFVDAAPKPEQTGFDI